LFRSPRKDIFANKLTGTIPLDLIKIPVLQIIHLKNNKLSGTIPPGIGSLPLLSWLDLSQNQIHGTIPPSFGTSRFLKDLRLAGNMIYDPIPPELCTNSNLNGGVTKAYGCDGVLCSLGTYSDSGHAIDDKGCIKCPDGETTLYIGSTSCVRLSEADILSIFFYGMYGDDWPEDTKLNWADPVISPCEWGGITCDSEGEIVSLSFPLLRAEHFDEENGKESVSPNLSW
jgi:hypothetical protein